MKKLTKWFSAILAAATLAAGAAFPAAADGTPTPAPTASPTPAPTTERESIESEANINVTVPLYVAMYAFGQTGAVVVPDPGAYCIENYTEKFDVEVTGVRGTNADMSLTSDVARQDWGELYLQLNNTVVVDQKEQQVSWIVGEYTEQAEKDGSNVLPIKIGAKIGARMNNVGTKKACTVQYTLKPVYTYNQVTFDVNAESLETEAERTADYGDVTPDSIWVKKGETFTVPDMALDGYKFKYWVNAGLNRFYEPGEEGSVEEDTVLYARWEIDHTSRFHVSSDLLEEAGRNKAYNVVDWKNNGIDIELYNYEKENTALVAGDKINYTVYVNDAEDQSGSLGTTKTDKAIHIAAKSGWTQGQQVVVKVVAKNDYGDPKTLQATFTLSSKEYPTYTYKDQGDGTVLLWIDANDYKGGVAIDYGTKVVPDNTNNLMSDWKSGADRSDGIIQIMPNTRTELRFMKVGSSVTEQTNARAESVTTPSAGYKVTLN